MLSSLYFYTDKGGMCYLPCLGRVVTFAVYEYQIRIKTGIILKDFYFVTFKVNCRSNQMLQLMSGRETHL